MISAANYVLEKVSGQYIPAQYPGEKSEKWVIPEDISTEYTRLNSIIESKYSREYLKICAFYNKMFPSLKSSGYSTSSYNVPAFTALDQERNDTGTGISSNYLKQIADQIVSRLGTLTFEPALLADVPTLEYIVYRDEVERQLRKGVRSKQMAAMTTEVFHDAAIVGYSHEFIDPVTDELVKANDYEIGMFESQLNRKEVHQMLYRNYAFPTLGLAPYLVGLEEKLQEEIVSEIGTKDAVDFRIFFDCPGQRAVISIGNKTLPPVCYPFDRVQVRTFGWDIGFSAVTSTSLFDLLYPIQRELNKVNAKIQQLIRMYKGPVPVFSNDVDLAMKAITNGTGEALYVDSSRPIDTLMTVINPTPLDAALTAVKNDLKTEMYELAGIQQVTFNAENLRSAAAVIAMDQTRDIVFQAQLAGIANFVAEVFHMQVHYAAVKYGDETSIAVDKLLGEARVELKPVTITSPLGNKGEATEGDPDYAYMAVARVVLAIMKGKMNFESLPYTVDKLRVKSMAAHAAVQLNALGIEVPDSLEQFFIDAFIDDIKTGAIQI